MLQNILKIRIIQRFLTLIKTMVGAVGVNFGGLLL
jgi:hypothetical protein